jgi:hypothetical protein
MYKTILGLIVAVSFSTLAWAQQAPREAVPDPAAQPIDQDPSAAAPSEVAPTEPAYTQPRRRPTQSSRVPPQRAAQPPAQDPVPAQEPAPEEGESIQPIEPLTPVAGGFRPSTKVTDLPLDELPSDGGQVFREYDISPYTLRVTATNRPEQSLVDWILRETGYEAWHGEPLAILSAGQRTLRVYHTPQVQAVVSDIVDRFVSSQAESHAFGLNVVSVGNPNWRARAVRLLQPVAVESAGIQAWLLQKEDAALLRTELAKRSDFREHSAPHLIVNNGQSTTVTSAQPRRYVKQVIQRPGAWPGFEPDYGQIDEGFSLELSPLLTLDGRTIDAVLKCNIDQVEKMIPVMLETPTAASPRQQSKIEVPQTCQVRLHERFRWPINQVLLVSVGVVAPPTAEEQNFIVRNLKIPSLGPSRADLLVFVESRGPAASAPSDPTRTPQAQPQTPGTVPVTATPAINNRGRY